jgi:hypothetical protein
MDFIQKAIQLKLRIISFCLSCSNNLSYFIPKYFMPESRNRPGHQFQKKSAIPSKQRTKGRVIWAILFAVFGLLIAIFSVGLNYPVLAIIAVACGALGYVIGKNMEQDATHKA